MMHIEANKRFDKSNQMLNVGMDWYEMETEIEIEIGGETESERWSNGGQWDTVPFYKKT